MIRENVKLTSTIALSEQLTSTIRNFPIRPSQTESETTYVPGFEHGVLVEYGRRCGPIGPSIAQPRDLNGSTTRLAG